MIAMDNTIKANMQLLHEKYGKMTLSKQELAKELGISLATVTVRMQKGMNLPNYIKVGSAPNGAVTFPLRDVAEYLTVTVKVA